MQCTYTDTQSSLRHTTPDFLARSTSFRDAAQHFRVMCATADAVRPDVGSAESRIRRERMRFGSCPLHFGDETRRLRVRSQVCFYIPCAVRDYLCRRAAG